MQEINFNLPIPMAVFKCAADWEVVEVNDKLCELCGQDRSRLLQRDGFEGVVYERDLAIFEEMLESVARGKSAETCDIRIVEKDGIQRWARVECSFLYRKEIAPYISCAFIDIQEQKEAEQKLRLINEQYQMLGEITKEIPFEMDILSWKVLVAKRFFEMRGDADAADRYCSFSDILKCVHPEDQDAVIKAVKGATVYEKAGTVEYRINMSVDKDDYYVWFRTYYRSITDDDGSVIRLIGRSYNVDKAKVIYDEAKRDPLTKLFNKVETQKAIVRAIEEYPDDLHAMFVIDVDDFKEINDTFGHTYGDTVIIDIANTIKENFRSEDIVGRVGGDEFVVFMKDVPREKVIEKAKKLCQALEKSYRGDAISKQISVSMGIAFYGKDGRNYQTLFENADRAMYRAKQGGKSGFEVAKEEDAGPIKKKERSVENRVDLSMQDKEFLTFATGLMTHARNIDGSLNMLLKRISDRFNLDLVAIFEIDPSGKNLVLSNYYSEKYSFYEKSLFPKTSKQLEGTPVGEMVEIRRASRWMYQNGIKEWKNASELDNVDCAILAGKFEHIGVTSGYIYYVSMDKIREWAPNEVALLSELTRAIAVFVSLRIRMDESKKEIRKIQRKDQLTGLYNFDTFQSKVKEIMNHPKPDKVYALEYLDINNFGYVNDNYGYQVGDYALKMFAELTKSQPYYVAGSHLYSDFFVILFAADTKEALTKSLNEQHKKFARLQSQQYPSSSMRICSGVYIFEDKYTDVEMAFENANLAWKMAKHSRSKEIVFFTDELRNEKKAEQAIIGEFYDALSRNDFQMYLQPKFMLRDGRIYGAEALARWKKPNGAVLPPGMFLEPLEKIGYVTELDFYIFEELLKTMQSWIEEGIEPLVVSTNFSGRHFEQDGQDFVDRIQMLLDKYIVPAKYIEIEITEGVFIKNKEVLNYCLDKLRETGFSIAIDDFGTGYSSLSVLTDIPVDVVKMDKSFIDKADSKKQRELITEIGKLIQIAGKDVIFEGIETAEQRDFLSTSGFSHGQGYLCNKPLPADEFKKIYLKDQQ